MTSDESMTLTHNLADLLRPTPSTAPPFRLDVEHGGGAPATRPDTFSAGHLVIGRPAADMVTLSEGTSPKEGPQAQIRWQTGLYWLINAGGGSPMHLNGRCLEAGYRYSLHHGDSITVGDYRIGFLLDAAGR